MAPPDSEFLGSLGTEIIDIYVGKQNEHRRLHKDVFEQRLPGFVERYLKDDTTTEVNLPHLTREAYGFLVRWLISGDAVFGQGFYKDAHSAAEILCELYGFAEGLGANDLMDDTMTALYAAHFNDPHPLPFHYTTSYNYTKPGSKLRDFQARRFVWELVNMEKRRQEFLERERFLLATILRGYPMSNNGFGMYQGIAQQTPELMNDIWPILSELSLDLSPPYHHGVCKFHMHSEEEECSAAPLYKEPRNLQGSRADSVDSDAGDSSTNEYLPPRLPSPAPSTRYGSSERGFSPDSGFNAGLRTAGCRSFQFVNDSRSYQLYMEHSSSCGKPTEVVDLGRCESDQRGSPSHSARSMPFEGSSERGSPAPSNLSGPSEPRPSTGSVSDASTIGAKCRTSRNETHDGFQLIREHSSSCGKPIEVVDVSHCEPTTRGRSSIPRSESSAGSPSTSHAGGVASSSYANCRFFLPVNDDKGFRLVRTHVASCGKPADVLFLDSCSFTARGRSSSPRPRSAAASPSGSRAESPADERPSLAGAAEKLSSEPTTAAGSRAESSIGERPLYFEYAEKVPSSI